MVFKRQDLEQYFNENDGEITDETDIIWKDTDLAIKDKVDSYGFVLDGFEAQEQKLKEFQDKLRLGFKRIDATRERLKRRLNDIANRLGEKHLRGNVYSFHPFESSRRVITHPELLEDNERYLTIEIRADHWETLIKSYGDYMEEYGRLDEVSELKFDIKGTKGKVSELPDGHPAVETIHSPSVRIT